MPGHWEGDLIIGRASKCAVATLAERASRFCLIIALPQGRTADKAADALADRILTLPQALRCTLTWDRGTEMADHAAFTLASGVPVYFADPHAPWQRGTNQNTNGLIRYYLPKASPCPAAIQQRAPGMPTNCNATPRRLLPASGQEATGSDPAIPGTILVRTDGEWSYVTFWRPRSDGWSDKIGLV